MTEVALTFAKFRARGGAQLRISVEHGWGSEGIEELFTHVQVSNYLVAGGSPQRYPLLLAASTTSAKAG